MNIYHVGKSKWNQLFKIFFLINFSDIALIKNNAFIGAQISSELHKLREQQRKKTDFYSIPNKLQGFCHSECGNSSSNKKENVIYDTIGKSVDFHSYSLKTNLAEKEKAFQVIKCFNFLSFNHKLSDIKKVPASKFKKLNKKLNHYALLGRGEGIYSWFITSLSSFSLINVKMSTQIAILCANKFYLLLLWIDVIFKRSVDRLKN